jgi:5'-methylthioadenosine phosphorylase
MVKVGIIGGSGIYNPSMFNNVHPLHVDTPFGLPSSPVMVGEYDGIEVAFLSRHGADHRYSPSVLNYRANIFALKKIGVTHIISASAVGSLREDYKPLDIVIPDQVYDRTTRRVSTFFEAIVAHISFADPFCPTLSKILYDVSAEKYSTHMGGTYLCMEGPQFSTKAESRTYRKLGFDIIGMTALPEAKLAREAEMCFAIVATITDYDVWKEDEPVSIGQVIENATKNEQAVQDIIRRAIKRIPEERECPCTHALEGAIATSPDAVPLETKQKLSVILDKYMK